MASHMPHQNTGLTPVEGRSYARYGTMWTCVRYNPLTGYVKVTSLFGWRVMGIGEFRATFGTHS